ncbi:hypothetical protein F53441_3860 [Fusarium austroafricanum]|uniref:Zn(2)-C6 fungal-type domain-containing protein n=1 Tax=Fusarium austroafricanum TaxID=2364996 RepID=A0A8H4KLH4_9HYPO|nr:hypothetical protein F53441_3860 [Fusarium austroafricanum]
MASSSKYDISVDSELRGAAQKRAGAENSRAHHRASLACVPCRSKHIKCDGYLPLCTRCKTVGKPCRYVNSRRGIGDPKKRNTIKDEALMTGQDDITESTPSSSLTGFHIPTSQSTSHTLNGRLFDLYYAYFHVAYSWLPPSPLPSQVTLEHIWTTEPENLRFLITTVRYIGSLYLTPDTGNTSQLLQEKAQEMSQEPLPPTILSVQALLSLSIAAFGQQRDKVYEPMFILARGLALSLGLQHKKFANEQPNLILAESCRRTYWGLYIHEMLLDVRGGLGPSLLYSTVSDLGTELPCEEWEYQAGNIPVPVTLKEYDLLGSSREYSSWACFIDLMLLSYELGRVGGEHSGLYAAAQSPYGVTTEPEVALPPVLQAPLRLVYLFRSLLPEKVSPSCIPNLERTAKLLEYGSFFNEGQCRARLRFLAEVLRKSGEFWPRSKALSDEVYQTLNRSGHMESPQSMVANSAAFVSSASGDSNWLMPPTMGPIGFWPEPTSQSVRDVPMLTTVMPWSGMIFQVPGGEMSPSGLTDETGRFIFEPQHQNMGTEGKSSAGFPRVKTESK